MEINRRVFLGAAAATAAAAGGVAQGRKIGLGLIGCGWWGMVDLRAALEAGGVEVLALCDVDSEHLAKGAAEVARLQNSTPRVFRDYRELLRTPGLEAVIIASPPHWHALMFLDAVDQGLDIYCEKPLAYDVREGQAMVRRAREQGRIVQVGFQRRQSDAVTQAAEYIRSGKAGRIVQVDAQIHYAAEPADSRVQDPPVTLDWEQWCGPAPLLPYRPSIGHFAWRLEAAYGNGHLVDWGIHWIDAVRHILGLGLPRFVQAAGGNFQLSLEITTPDTLAVHFDYERCPLVWRHRIWGAAEHSPEVANGMFFFGDEATVFVADEHWEVIPRARGKQRLRHEAKPDKSFILRHMGDFLQAVRSRRQPSCTVADAFQSTAAVQLAMISYRTGSRISWDPDGDTVAGSPEAAALLRRDYRSPWKHPGQA